MKYLLVFVIGFAVSGMMFGLNVLLQQFFIKRKLNLPARFSFQFIGLIFSIPVFIIFGGLPFNFASLLDWKLWLVALITVMLTSLIVLTAKRKGDSSESILLSCAEGAAMEILQRVMMQTFVCGLLLKWGLKPVWGILITALIWCADQFVTVIFFSREKEWKKTLIENLSSFVFSIGIGYVFFGSACFVLPMLAHAAERFVTKKIERKR